MSVGLISLCISVLVALASMMRASWIAQRSIMQEFSDLRDQFKDGLATLRLDISKEVNEVVSTARKETAQLREDAMRSINRNESDIRDLGHRLTSLEAGQSEWIKALRGRTHELSNEIHKMAVKVELLACGQRPPKESAE